MSRPPHVIVLPGGGYWRHADHERAPVIEWLESLGLEASELLYPVKTEHPGPLDAVRARAGELRASGVERLGVIGFSAGGHLAGHAAVSGLVDAAILCYPVVSMETETHADSQRWLAGENADDERRRALSIDRLVTAAMPPTFVWHTAEDASVRVEHAYRLGAALAEHDVPHALHVYPQGKHGLGLAEGEGAAARWPEECAGWLRRLGWVD